MGDTEVEISLDLSDDEPEPEISLELSDEEPEPEPAPANEPEPEASDAPDDDADIDLDDFEDVDDVVVASLGKAKSVTYCGVCGLPPEFCEWGPTYEACKPWIRDHMPHLLGEGETVAAAEPQAEQSKRKTKKQKNKDADEQILPGGKVKKKEKQGVHISRDQRNKRKFVTLIAGLDTFDIVLKDASKVFSNKLSCGASITKTPTGKKQIDVQGDFVDEVYELIRTKYPEIPDDKIVVKT